jgi:hypothetical protein
MLKCDYLFMDTHLDNHSVTSYMNWRLFYTAHYFSLVLFHVYSGITSQRFHILDIAIGRIKRATSTHR